MQVEGKARTLEVVVAFVDGWEVRSKTLSKGKRVLFCAL